MSTSITTWRIPKAAWLAIGCAAAAEATSNALRAYGLGMHLEAFTLTTAGVTVSVAGAVLVLAAVAVTFTQTRATWVALTPGDTHQRIVCGAGALLLLSISVTAMVSHILEAQRAKVSDESGERGDYDRGISEYASLINQKKALQKYGDDGQQLPRDALVVQAAIDRFPIHPGIWRRSKQCTDITQPESRLACQPVLDLREEQGAHASLVPIDRKIEAIRTKLAAIKRPEEVEQAEAWLAGKWAWIMGIGVVFIATFGPVIFAKVERSEQPPENVSPAETNTDRWAQSDFPAVNGAELGTVRELVPVAKGPKNSDGPGSDGRTVRLPRRPNSVGPTGERLSKLEAEQFVITELALGRSFPSQDTLVGLCGRPKQTISDWMKNWERRGLVPARTQRGRCKALASN